MPRSKIVKVTEEIEITFTCSAIKYDISVWMQIYNQNIAQKKEAFINVIITEPYHMPQNNARNHIRENFPTKKNYQKSWTDTPFEQNTNKRKCHYLSYFCFIDYNKAFDSLKLPLMTDSKRSGRT